LSVYETLFSVISYFRAFVTSYAPREMVHPGQWWRPGPAVLTFGLMSGVAMPAEPAPGPLLRLTSDGLEKERPSWAPGGRRLLFARHDSGGMHVWQYILDTKVPGAVARRLTDRKEPEYNGTFSPDGTRIVFAAITLSGTQGNLDLAAINADGSGLKTLFA